jgi:outer membrane protein TolC
MWNSDDLPACSAGDKAPTSHLVTWSPCHLVILMALMLAALEASPGHAQTPVPPPAPAPVAGPPEDPLPPPRPTMSPRTKEGPENLGGGFAHPSQKSPLEVPPPPSGEVVDLKVPDPEPGDVRFPINLGTALRLADGRPLIVAAAQASAWVAEAQLQQAKVIWIPTLNIGFNYTRHDGFGPDTLRGVNIPAGENSLGQNAPGSYGRSQNQNVNFFYAGGALFLMEWSTTMLFEPLAARQMLNAARWDIQTAKNDALYQTAIAYFNVHRARGQYAGALDVVYKGRRLVEEIADLSQDLVPRVEIDRARNLLASLEQQAVFYRQQWRRSSANLTQVLRLDPRSVVEPLEHDHLQITLIDPDRSLDDLIPVGLTNRPELAAHQAQVQAALVRIRKEKLRPWLPVLEIQGFQTPYEQLEVGVFAIGNGGKMNNWTGRFDLAPEIMWKADSLGLGNMAMVKYQRGAASRAEIELFKVQDMVAADVTRAQARLQSAAARVVQAERELRGALINYNGSYEGLKQTKRFENVLVQVFRPQEAVFALQLLKLAYDNYFVTVAEYNIAQFQLFHALGYPAQEISFFRKPGEVLPVNTERPAFLPPVGTGPPTPTR